MKEKYDLVDNLQVDPEKIICRNCRFKSSGMKIKRGEQQYTMCFCEKYVYPNTKPAKILFENGGCGFFQQEQDRQRI